jgi:hypothetical protein
MFNLRCTQKLLTRLKLRPAPQPPQSTTNLGDWYANTLNLGRERLVLCVSELTLLPVVVPAAGAALDAKLVRGLKEMLEALGAPATAIEGELRQMTDVNIAKTASRVVLGSMNDFENMAQFIRRDEPMASLLSLGLELARSPCSPIGYDRPQDTALAALGGKGGGSKAKLRLAPPPAPSAPKPRVITNAEYEEMVEAATVDAYGESEEATGWHCMLDEHLRMPFETEMLGVAVRVEKIDLLDDDSIVAVCRRGQHRQTVPILDLPMPRVPPEGAEWVEAYRRWKR